jgi:hypothetical protein
MIIHQPELFRKNGFTTVFSCIEVNNKSGFFPDFIWYRVPEQYGGLLTTRSDAFLVPGLLAGMYFGEDIEVRGVVSPKLAYQLEEYQYLLNFRFPKYQHPIQINYDRLRALDILPRGVGASFSGGVDSLFTLWKHLPQNQPVPGFKITYSIFINGFDLLESEDHHYKFLYEKYNKSLSEIGVDLIPLQTNIVSITHKRLDLHLFYGPIIVATGMALAGGLGRYYAPSSGDYAMLNDKAYTADPLMDHLLSTETLDVIHHGSTHVRVEKVEEIADWEVAQKLLWVCEIHQFKKDTWNCSRCEKCVRSMIPLYALGKLENFKTFEKPFRTNRDGLWWARKYSTERVFGGEIFPFVKKHKPEWLPWLRAGAALGSVRFWLFVKLVPGFMKKWLRRYGYFVARNEAPDAFEFPEVSQHIRENYDHPPA